MSYFDLQIFYFSHDFTIITANIYPLGNEAGSHPSQTQQECFDFPESDKGLHSWEGTRDNERQIEHP